MNQILRKTLGGLCFAGTALPAAAQMPTNPLVKGPSTATMPYQYPVVAGGQMTSVLTVGDTVSGYRMAGIPDGIGAWDNGDGTFTLLCNHEMGNTSGAVHAFGSKGAFVSKWIISKNTASPQVLGGQDLTQRINLYNRTTGTWVAYGTNNPLDTSVVRAGLGRFCSGDVPAVSAFYNAATGKGTQQRFIMNGEETGAEGRVFAHLATGPNAGNTYELPHLGRASWENQVANPRASDTTIVIGMDDATPGQVYVYVGLKQASGNEITRAGLVGGKLYGISVNNMTTETASAYASANTPFTMTLIDTADKLSGSQIESISTTLGVTRFLRPEDGAWDPKNPSDFYFLTTNGINTSYPTITNPSRLWRLRFTNISNPALGGTITPVLEGSEGQQMMDNMTIDNNGLILIEEDPGGNNHVAKTWQYNIATDSLKLVASHDTVLFRDPALGIAQGQPSGYVAPTQVLTIDEEASGIVDMQDILGAGWFFGVDQIHTTKGLPSSLAAEVVERGQMFLFFNPDSYNANAEIDFAGANSTAIPNNSMTPSTGNGTDFGTAPINQVVTKTFTVKNTGVAALKITGMSFTGMNASEFTLVNAPALPLTLATNATQTLTVQFKPTAIGLRTAMLNMASNDFDESNYKVAVQGVGLNTTGIAGLPSGASALLYPNPTADNAVVELSLKGTEHITVSLMDLQGRTVAQAADGNMAAGDHKITINTSSLPSGNYLVQLTAGNTVTRTKLVVAH